MGQAHDCSCCSGAGSKVVQEPLLADGAATPRQQEKAALTPPSIGTPNATALSDRNGNGSTGDTYAGKSANSGDTGGTDGDLEATGAKKARGNIISGLKDGSLNKLCEEADQKARNGELAAEGLTGLEWARQFGGGKAEENDSDWAQQIALELKQKPLRDGQETDPGQGLTGMEWAKAQKGGMVSDDDKQVAALLANSQKRGGAESQPEEEAPAPKGAKKGLSRQMSAKKPIGETEEEDDADIVRSESTWVQVGDRSNVDLDIDGEGDSGDGTDRPQKGCCMSMRRR